MPMQDTSKELTCADQPQTALVVASSIKAKTTLSKRLGDIRGWAQALAATYASRAMRKEQGSMHRV